MPVLENPKPLIVRGCIAVFLVLFLSACISTESSKIKVDYSPITDALKEIKSRMVNGDEKQDKKEVIKEDKKPENHGALYVSTQPESSRVRIMNIKPVFHQGIVLGPGQYLIEVSHQGYETYKKWITLGSNESKSLNVNLSPEQTINKQEMMVQTPPPPKPVDIKRLSLIIGNAEYRHGGRLKNPINDANGMNVSLKRLNFDTLKYENADLKTMKRAINTFGNKLKTYDVGLFFYAGHGIQVSGVNYLIPVDAKLDNENDVDYDCINVGRVLAKMESAKTKTNIIILDACRNNPFERSWNRSSKGRGLAFMDAPVGSLIAYATSPGTTAADGSGENGLYTAALLSNIETPEITIMEMFQKVRSTVKSLSGGCQIPWESTCLMNNFYFKP